VYKHTTRPSQDPHDRACTFQTKKAASCVVFLSALELVSCKHHANLIYQRVVISVECSDCGIGKRPYGPPEFLFPLGRWIALWTATAELLDWIRGPSKGESA